MNTNSDTGAVSLDLDMDVEPLRIDSMFKFSDFFSPLEGGSYWSFAVLIPGDRYHSPPLIFILI